MNSDTVNPLYTEPKPKNRFIIIALLVSVFLHFILLSQNFTGSSVSITTVQSNPLQLISLSTTTEQKVTPILDTPVATQPEKIKQPTESLPESVKNTIVSTAKSNRSVLSDEPILAPKPVEDIQLQAGANTQPNLTDTSITAVTKQTIEMTELPDFNAEAPDNTVSNTAQQTNVSELPQNPTRESAQGTGIVFSLPNFKGGTPIAITPDLAKRKRQFGRVIVRGFVNEAGMLEQAAVYQSSGYDILDTAALDQASKWQYSPAIRDLVNTGQWVEIPIEFR